MRSENTIPFSNSRLTRLMFINSYFSPVFSGLIPSRTGFLNTLLPKRHHLHHHKAIPLNYIHQGFNNSPSDISPCSLRKLNLDGPPLLQPSLYGQWMSCILSSFISFSILPKYFMSSVKCAAMTLDIQRFVRYV